MGPKGWKRIGRRDVQEADLTERGDCLASGFGGWGGQEESGMKPSVPLGSDMEGGVIPDLGLGRSSKSAG